MRRAVSTGLTIAALLLQRQLALGGVIGLAPYPLAAGGGLLTAAAMTGLLARRSG